MNEIKIGNYTLTGGGMCPEQYDVFKGDTEVAYLRLRHGEFTATLTDSDVVVFTDWPNGDGCFDDNERQQYLEAAIAAIDYAIKLQPPDEPLADLGGGGR